MSDPSASDDGPGDDARTRGDPTSTAASDGGEPGGARAVADTVDPSGGEGGGSALRTIGVAFGLGIAGILGLLVVTTLVGGAVVLAGITLTATDSET